MMQGYSKVIQRHKYTYIDIMTLKEIWQPPETTIGFSDYTLRSTELMKIHLHWHQLKKLHIYIFTFPSLLMSSCLFLSNQKLKNQIII